MLARPSKNSRARPACRGGHRRLRSREDPMKSRNPIGTLCLALIILALATSAAHAEDKTLTRTLDPVIVSGEKLKPLWNAKTESLRLMALQGGKLVPIPFQIDKIDPDGNYIIAMGTVPKDVIEEVDLDDRPESEKRAERIEDFEKRREKYRKRVAKGELSNEAFEALRTAAYHTEQLDALDYNDELVFMARDAGGRVAKEKWPTPEGLELTLKDPLTNATGWVYLLYWKAGLPPLGSDADYVKYEPNGDIVETSMMKLDFVDDKPLIMERIFPRRANGDQLPNIVDRFKMRIKIKPTPLFCMSLNFDESNIEAFTVGYKDGPVRVIRRNIFWLKIAGIKLPFVPQAQVYYTFYETGLTGPAEVQNPFDPTLLLCKGSVGGGGMDFLKSMNGARVTTEANPGTAVFDGHMSEAEENLVRDNQRWASIVREADKTAFLIRIVQGERLRKAGVNNQLFYYDDIDMDMEPESEPGARYAGFGVNILQVPKGTFKLWFHICVTADYSDEKRAEYLNIVDYPVVVDVE